MRFLFIFVFILVVAPKTYAECEPIGVNGHIKGVPIVAVAALFPKRASLNGIEGCVTLSYRLVPKDPEWPIELVPSKLVVLGATEPERNAFVNAAKESLSNWLFLARDHKYAATTSYYSVVSFDAAHSGYWPKSRR